MDLYLKKLVAVRKTLCGIEKHTVANALELQRVRKKLMEMLVQELKSPDREKYKSILSCLLELEQTLFRGIRHSPEFDSAKNLLIRHIDEIYVLHLEDYSFEMTALD